MKPRLCPLLLCLLVPAVWGHGVPAGDSEYVQSVSGLNLIPFVYLGAKHMITGYDHLLFLAGVIFFLYRLRDIVLYATLFALGHSCTLLFGVLAGIHANSFFVDAVIALSVVYKALENLGALRYLPFCVDTRVAVTGFGLAHGFGLSTMLQRLDLSADGLVGNLIAFNFGVELGQLAALTIIFLVLQIWRRTPTFNRTAYAANVLIMAAGMLLFGYQIAGSLLSA